MLENDVQTIFLNDHFYTRKANCPRENYQNPRLCLILHHTLEAVFLRAYTIKKVVSTQWTDTLHN